MKSLIRKLLREGLIKESLISSPLYHGTKYNFEKFDLKFFNSGSGDGGWLGRGIYLTNDYEYAESYGNVLECTVNIKNPYIITDYVYSRSPEKLANDLGVTNSREITSKLIKEGYDSVILTYPDKGYSKDDEYDKFIEICVFNPNDVEIVGGINEGKIVYHGSPNDFKEFKLKKGSMFNKKGVSPIFLTTDKDNFAKYYAKQNGCVYKIELSDDIKLFDFRKLVDWWDLKPTDYGYKLYNDMYSGKYDLTPYNDDIDKLYDYIQSGEYSILERKWFFDWLQDNHYDGSYVIETRTLNLFIFDPKKIRILDKDCGLVESAKLNKVEFFDVEDRLLDSIPNNMLYHGSDNITWFNSVDDIDTINNTTNARSKYLFLSPNKKTALNYSINSIGMNINIGDTSGVISFKLKKSRGKRLTTKDLKYDSMSEFESILDSYKKDGYDYLIIQPDGNNYVILNPSILEFADKMYNKKILKNEIVN